MVRSGRKRKNITERELSDLVGVDQTRISQIELGKGEGAPLSLWIAIGLALDQPLAVAFSRPLGEPREPSDVGHLAMQERLLALARATGRSATFELPTRPSDPSRSIDVCVRDPRHRVLIIEEAWNTFADVGAASRSTARKRAEAADLAATIDDGAPYRVASVWVVPSERDEPEPAGTVSRHLQRGMSGLIAWLGRRADLDRSPARGAWPRLARPIERQGD